MSISNPPLEKKDSRSALRWLTMDRQRLQTLITLMVLIVMLAAFSSLNERFMTITNMRNVVRNISPLIIASAAVTPVMIARGLDLSIGSVLASAAVLAATLAVAGVPLWLAFGAGVLLGTAFGVINGLITVYLSVSPIIVTLGTLNIARGVAYLISPSAILVGLPQNWSELGTSSIGPVPTPIVIAGIVFILFTILMITHLQKKQIYEKVLEL